MNLTLSTIFFLNEIITDDDSRFNLAVMPVHEFRWLIIVSLLAFHVVLSIIVTELMARTYGKGWLWFLVTFLFPFAGPVACLIYYRIASSSILEGRKKSYWSRFFFDSPVSMTKILQKEQADAREASLKLYVAPNTNAIITEKKDTVIEGLIAQGKYSEARSQTWKMMEIARERGRDDSMSKYQDYLDIIALRESSERGFELSGK
jgi:hypothetical protein